MKYISRLPHNSLFDLLLLTLFCAVFFGATLGSRPYSAPSEARYVEIGREMAQSGDLVTPRLNYVKYFEKPPLFYWVQAGATRLWGVSPFVARIPTAFFALCLCLLTYGLGRMLYGRAAGIFAALVLASTLYMFSLSRIVLVDVPVSVFLDATLIAFLYAAYAPPGRARTPVVYLMYACAACAVLTKGLIGAVLPGVVIFLWLAITGKWRLLLDMRLATGTALFLFIAVPWHVLVAERNPEFLHFYFIHEHLERFLTKVHGRYQPPWFFAAVLLAGLIPWLTFVPQGLLHGLKGFWRNRRENAVPLFLVLWIGFIFIFFSLSDSKLIPYILPIFPPIAALTGYYFADLWGGKPVSRYRTGLFALIGLLVVIAVAPSLMLQLLDKDNKIIVALAQGGDEAEVLSIACMLGAMALLVIYIQGRTRHVIIALFAVAMVIVQLGDRVAAHYNKDSMEKFAGAILDVTQETGNQGAEVATYGNYYQDMPVYLKKRITVVNWKGELEFGTEHEDTSAWIIDTPTFWKRWNNSNKLMFAVMRVEEFTKLIKDKSADDLHLYALDQEGRNMLFMNILPTSLHPVSSPSPATPAHK